MLKKGAGLKIMLVCLSIAGIVQAIPLNTTTKWQNIGDVTWTDASGDNVIEVNELVTFTIEMEKYMMGRHLFDALKVWIDDDAVYQDIWYLTGYGDYVVNASKDFIFTYTFEEAGDYELTARVSCSDDLADVYNDHEWPYPGKTWGKNAKGKYGWIDKVTQNDWDAWTPTKYMWQGETEKYQLTVIEQSVPEPGSFSLILLGLASLAGAFLMKKKSK
jgi:hypothetical protein